jgi:hypothetical protein
MNSALSRCSAQNSEGCTKLANWRFSVQALDNGMTETNKTRPKRKEVLWLVNTYIPMSRPIKSILNAVVVIGPISNIRIGC